MKNLLLGLNVFPTKFIMFFARIASQLSSNTEKSSASDKVQPTTPPSNPNPGRCGIDDIPGVTVKEFAEVVARYNNTNRKASMSYAQSEVSPSFEDARTCWYSIERLKKFICLMEEYTEQYNKKVKQMNGGANIRLEDLGVRFYYATYFGGRDGVWESKYAGCHTLYLVPTFKDDNRNIDFDPRDSVNKEGPDPTRLDSLIESGSNQKVLFSLGGGQYPTNVSNSARMNFGDLCPPPKKDMQGCDSETTLKQIDYKYSSVGYHNHI